jgi:hypothetical protein
LEKEIGMDLAYETLIEVGSSSPPRNLVNVLLSKEKK